MGLSKREIEEAVAEAIAETYGDDATSNRAEAREVIQKARQIVEAVRQNLVDEEGNGLAWIAHAAAARYLLDLLEREDRGAVTLAGEKVALAIAGLPLLKVDLNSL